MREVGLSFNADKKIARQPRLRAILNDTTLLAPYTAQVIQHSSYNAGTYSLLVPLNRQTVPTAADWSNMNRARLRIQVSLHQHEPYVDLIEGFIDTIQINLAGGYVNLAGRDLSSLFLSDKTPIDFQNLSSTEIVSLLAIKHGLNPIMINTADYSGRYYANNKNVTALTQFAKLSSDWDILVALAQASGFDVFVVGRSLYFQPPVTLADTAQTIHTSDLTDLRMYKSLPHSNGTTVTITSWNSARGLVVSESKGAGPPGSPTAASAGSASSYTAFRPNLLSSDAQMLANQIVQSITGDAMAIQIIMPGDMLLSPRRPIRLEGSGTAFDRTYKIESIARVFRANSGFTQSVRARLLAESLP